MSAHHGGNFDSVMNDSRTLNMLAQKFYEDAEKDEPLFAQTDNEFDLSTSPWADYFVETDAEADAEIEWVAIPGINT